jgi:hypothetical protein
VVDVFTFADARIIRLREVSVARTHFAHNHFVLRSSILSGWFSTRSFHQPSGLLSKQAGKVNSCQNANVSQFFLRISGDCDSNKQRRTVLRAAIVELIDERDMTMTGRAISSTLSSTLVVLATVLLTACGPDDAASNDDAQGAAPGGAPQGTQSVQASSIQAENLPGTASEVSALAAATALANSASGSSSGATSDAAVTSVQASLAADSRQIAPVMHYAPGDDSN